VDFHSSQKESRNPEAAFALSALMEVPVQYQVKNMKNVFFYLNLSILKFRNSCMKRVVKKSGPLKLARTEKKNNVKKV
jgi:hypothetical protein